MIREIDARLKRARPATIFAISALAMAALVWLDIAARPELDFIPFHFIPVFFAAWYSGSGMGIFFAAASVISGSAMHYADSPQFWTPLRLSWTAGMRMISLSTLVWCCSELRRVGEREVQIRQEAQETASRIRASMTLIMGREIAGAVAVLETAIDFMRGREKDRAAVWENVLEVMDRMKTVSRGFIDESRRQSARISEKHEKIELGGVIADAVALFEPLAGSIPMNFTVEIESPARRVWADRAALSLILSTLLGQMIRASPPGGRVTIGVTFSKNRGGRAQVDVSCEGSDGALKPDDRAVVAGLLRLHNSELETTRGRTSFTLTEASEFQ